MDQNQQQEAVRSLSLTKVILPMILGILVVIYLLYRQFDPAELAKVSWDQRTLGWIAAAVGIFVLRHLAYSYRLWLLSDRFFSYRKCMKLIVIWEFSTAVSPSSVGGAIVSLFALSQENYPGGKTAALVIYTVVQDTLFFLVTLPLLFFLIGPEIIRPGMERFVDLDIYGIWFLVAYLIMFTYGSLLAYGLFVAPGKFRNVLVWITRFRFTRRFRAKAIEIGRDVVSASTEYTTRPWTLHVKSMLATIVAWSARFFVIAFLIFAMVESVTPDFATLSGLYGRLQAMFSIVLFIPTPGGAGVVEFLFGGFLSDYVPRGIAPVVAGIWRLMTYYSYLLLGAIIIPAWLARVMRKDG